MDIKDVIMIIWIKVGVIISLMHKQLTRLVSKEKNRQVIALRTLTNLLEGFLVDYLFKNFYFTLFTAALNCWYRGLIQNFQIRVDVVALLRSITDYRHHIWGSLWWLREQNARFFTIFLNSFKFGLRQDIIYLWKQLLWHIWSLVVSL